ncbi:hypothetical protein [Streptomyces gobiensis]|nr:hypothetical protein [Streptomyces gobiensis]
MSTPVQERERLDEENPAASAPVLLLAGEDEDDCAGEPHICRSID